MKEAPSFLLGDAGEEKQDYSQNLRSDGSVSSTTISWYADGSVRAKDANVDDVLNKTLQYRSGTSGSDSITGDRKRVLKGKRVDIGGRRNIEKKKNLRSDG